MITINDFVMALKLGNEDEEVTDLEAWFEEVVIVFILARAYSDARTWLRTARGPNSEAVLGEAVRLHNACLDELHHLEQSAHMLWGIDFKEINPSPRR